MSKKPDCIARLMTSGISWEDAHALRRIAMTLDKWSEYEAGTGEGQVSISIERDGDEPYSKPYMRKQWPTRDGYQDIRWPIADREKGAHKRLAAIMAKYPSFAFYIQGDPRGLPLYIIRPTDKREGQTLDQYYSNGIGVSK